MGKSLTDAIQVAVHAQLEVERRKAKTSVLTRKRALDNVPAEIRALPVVVRKRQAKPS